MSTDATRELVFAHLEEAFNLLDHAMTDLEPIGPDALVWVIRETATALAKLPAEAL